ncbi:exonuclease domain-containing protein [Noviherbaspirillum sp. ST9]|uniref:3'-5' exonuclease n=1 Tax=Noviherbaspirillum sp. ST9 TaxID=3401606 RepID=UPI003B587533
MNEKRKFIAALAALYTFLGAVTILLYVVLWATLGPDEQRAVLHILDGREALIIFILLAALAAIGLAFEFLYRHYVSAPLRLGEKLGVIVAANNRVRLPQEGSAELRSLTTTINQLADERDALLHDVQEKIADAKAAIEEEKNRFAALMSELSQSVIVCNGDGRILLYNNRARMMFQAPEGGADSAGNSPVGLGRSIFAVLERSLITHGIDRIHQRLDAGDAQPIANFVTSAQNAQLIRAQMAPVMHLNGDGKPEVGGYVLTLEDITRRFDLESQRDMVLQSLTEGSRSSLASVRAAVENLLSYPDMSAAQRDRFLGIVRDEVEVMGARLDRTANEFAGALKARWPLDDMLGVDLVQAARQRIEQRLGLLTKTEDIDEDLWIKADSYSLLQVVCYLAARLKEEFEVREVRFRLVRSERLVHLDLSWSGVIISPETLVGWELDPLTEGGENSPLTLREVVERHNGEIWFQCDKASHRSFFRLLVPAAPAPATAASVTHRGEGRPEYYDFDLFRQTAESRALDDRLLTQLTYTVFDTETTGLDPTAGDEIIQLGATRIVNGRLLRGEVFDCLIDPGRPVAPESAKIHGITNDMLAGRPRIERVLPDFHAFCEDTVLVAHNAAFDMRFLQMKEGKTGVEFRQPVLDTLLLSALIHPNQESHRLEAIAERLGVHIAGRHTALGDAIVTGEIFLKMLPLLQEKGIRTLRQAREAAERNFYAKLNY